LKLKDIADYVSSASDEAEVLAEDERLLKMLLFNAPEFCQTYSSSGGHFPFAEASPRALKNKLHRQSLGTLVRAAESEIAFEAVSAWLQKSGCVRGAVFDWRHNFKQEHEGEAARLTQAQAHLYHQIRACQSFASGSAVPGWLAETIQLCNISKHGGIAEVVLFDEGRVAEQGLDCFQVIFKPGGVAVPLMPYTATLLQASREVTKRCAELHLRGREAFQ
jgi:hypothetical protein